MFSNPVTNPNWKTTDLEKPNASQEKVCNGDNRAF
jgi:hypothetical protein